MNRINLFRNAVSIKAVRSNPATLNSVAWGKINLEKTASTLVFAGLLIACSLAVGCSSEKPKSTSSNNQTAMTQPTPPVAAVPVVPAPVAEAPKPAHKKTVRRATATATVNYADKTTGVSFQYPRKYSLKTGDAADKLVSSDGMPTGFVQPGGVAIAAVAVPESAYPKSDLGSAFFGVSMNKAMTEEQCSQFAEAKAISTDDPAGATAAPIAPKAPKLMIGNMELQSSEARYNEGAREEASKYYHVFENGACYEFALKVATTGVETEGGKRVDREEVFKKLEGILATVKIGPAAEKVTEPVAVSPTTAASSAQ